MAFPRLGEASHDYLVVLVAQVLSYAKEGEDGPLRLLKPSWTRVVRGMAFIGMSIEVLSEDLGAEATLPDEVAEVNGPIEIVKFSAQSSHQKGAKTLKNPEYVRNI